MDSETLRLILLVALGVTITLWVTLSLFAGIAGTWERVLSDDERAEGQRPERIVLGNIGPWVYGRSDVPGGHHDFTGVLVASWLTLKRRDHGVDVLMEQGFDESIAELRDGKQAARLSLRIVDGARLVGTFSPMKVNFTHQPPRVTDAYFLAPQARTYQRVIDIQEVAAAGLDAEPT